MTSSSAPRPWAAAAPGPMTLTARSPEDLLALAPVVLGFHPTDSVVMLTFGAASPFHARVDLPPGAAGPAGVAEVVESLVGPARRHGVRRAVLLVYATDRRVTQRLWEGLRRGLGAAGVEVVEALRVEQERWYPLVGRDERARRLGVPFDVSAHPFLVRAVVEGRVTLASRAALAATLDRDDTATERLARLTSARSVPCDLLAEGAWVEDLLTTQLGDGRLPTDTELARVLVALPHPGLRDAAWSALRRERARAAVAWWTHALTRCPETLVAAPAALLAWSAWLHGNGALAWCALDRCEEVEPGYGLARVVAELLERAHPPSSWAETIDWRTALTPAPRAG